MPPINGKLTNGRYLIKEAHKQGLAVVYGKGDHAKIYAPTGRGYMICPMREMGKGLASEVVKWLVKAGVILTCLLIIGGLFALGMAGI
jgi:hypothetical protein